MSVRRLHLLPLLCALFLCLLTSPGGALEFIWCIGADGHSHARLQTGQNEDCCDPRPAAPAADHDDRGLSQGAREHADCLHIAITGQLGTAASRDNLAMDDAPAAAGSSASPAFALRAHHDLTAGFPPEPPPRVTELILQHRTIVLLI